MTILLFGGFGQLGTALQQRLGERAVSLPKTACDLMDADAVDAVLQRARPEVVINCAAYNFVDRAEQDPQRAIDLNVLAVKHLARACAARNVFLVQISSDHVFGGDLTRTTPYREEDPPAPLSVYGNSKWGGEKVVTQLCERSLIVRTCGLYGATRSAGKGNFVETMLRLASRQKELSVVDDQRCTPTSTTDLAEALDRLIAAGATGLYHVTNAGDASWCEFAREILQQSGNSATVKGISTADFGAAAPRPAYSVLDCRKLEGTIGGALPHWTAALSAYLKSRKIP
jgi:dTDP-4-dehydrorhamnose reductase